MTENFGEDPQKVSINILTDGSTTENDTHRDVVAKMNRNPYSKRYSYYIRHENGRMVNPLNRDKRRHIVEQAQWKVVSETVFNLYLQFLHTRKTAYLSKAEREHHD